MADPNPLFDDLGIDRNPASAGASDNPLMSDLGIEHNSSASAAPTDTKEPDSWGSSIKGEIDAGLTLGTGAIAGTAGSVLRTVNRMIPDWDGTKEELKDKIDAAQSAMTWDPKTPEGRYVLDKAGKVINPIAHGLSEATGAVVGKENVPAVADVVGAIPGVDAASAIPSALVRGAVRGGTSGAEAMAASAKAAEDAGLKTSVGAASGNPIVRSYEAVASKLPGGGPLKEARDVNSQAEESVSNIIKKIHPDYDKEPTTARSAGEEIQEGAEKTIANKKAETGAAAKEMNDAVGGENTPMPGPRIEEELRKIQNPTGIQEVDEALQGAKTRAVAKTINAVTEKPKVSTSYSTDGEGAHVIKSPNGETHLIEQANGDLKAWRSDTEEFDDEGMPARGRGEGTARLETAAQIATSKGAKLVSDTTVSPAQAAAYEKLGRKGWTVEKNPNAEISANGNILSDSPKNPVYTVKTPNTEVTPGAGAPKQTSSEKQFTGEWTYDPKTGRSEPVTTQTPKSVAPTDKIQAKLNADTPWTFGSFRALRTQIGQAIKGNMNVGQKTQLQRLYGAMSDDLTDFVRSKGPEAEQNYQMFNSIAKGNKASEKALTKIIKNEGGPGEIFNKAMRGSAADSDRISRVMGAMDKDGQNTLRAVVLHKLGRVSGAETGPFSADTFLKNWDKMSQPAKNVLFGGAQEAGQLRRSLDSLTSALTDMKAGGQIRSGLTTSIQQAGHGIGKGAGLLGALVFLKEFGQPMARVAEGHPITGMAAATAGVGALAVNPAMSRILTNPKVVSWLAQSTRMPKSGLPGMMVQLHQMGQKDSDARDLETLISQQGEGNKVNEGGGMSDDRPITNSHKMIPMKSPSGSTFYGVDPSTL